MKKIDTEKLQLFENQEIRTAWEAEKEEVNWLRIVTSPVMLDDAKK